MLDRARLWVWGCPPAARARVQLRGVTAVSLGAAGLAVVLLLTCPRAAQASGILLEHRSPSLSRVVDGTIRDATHIPVPAGSFAIYGTLKPGEEVDAYEFVASSSFEATVTLLLKEGVWLGDVRPTLLVASGGGEAVSQGRPRTIRRGQFDWRSLERLRGEADAQLTLTGGQSYILTIRPGTATGLTVPYVLISSSPEGSAATGVGPGMVLAVPRLWLGAYAQRQLRTLPGLAAILVAGLLLALVVYVLRTLARAVGRLKRALPTDVTGGAGTGAVVQLGPADSVAGAAAGRGPTGSPTAPPAPAARPSEPKPEPEPEPAPPPTPAPEPEPEPRPHVEPETRPIANAAPEMATASDRLTGDSTTEDQHGAVAPGKAPRSRLGGVLARAPGGLRRPPEPPPDDVSLSLEDRLHAYLDTESKSASNESNQPEG